ncbi:hypothetical protein FRC01_005122 [Tulasnella sp. 417]|nr:hypothetical protein FRC01_005122 [Tulasnella sp. 417]
MSSKTQTRSKSVSSAEEGEVSEDEAMDVDPMPTLPSATERGPQSEANIAPRDDFSMDERSAWYQGRSPDEPARPGVLDDSMTVAHYVEAQLLVLDLLGFGVPAEDLFRGFGLSTALLTTIFNDLHLRLPRDLIQQEPSTSPQSQEEEPVPSPALLPSRGDTPSSSGHSTLQLPQKPSLSTQAAFPPTSDTDLPQNSALNQTESSSGEDFPGSWAPPSPPAAVTIEVLEPPTPPLNSSNDPNAIVNEVIVTPADEGQEVPVRKRIKLDLLLREKLAKVKAKEAVASRSKSPSLPPSQPPQVSSPAAASEANSDNPMPPQRERSATETKLDTGGPPPRAPFQPPRSAAVSFWDVPPSGTPASLDYGLPSPSPEVPHGKPVRSYSYDSRSVSRPGKRLRATDFIDDTNVQPFFPMLDPYTKLVIDISDDEDEVEEHLREDTPVEPSEDAQAYPESRATGSMELEEPASADAFLGSLMDELVEPSGKVDPSDEIKRLKAKIAAMEAMHKTRIMESSRQNSVDPFAQEVSALEAESVISTPLEAAGEDSLAAGVIHIGVGDEADIEDEEEREETDDKQDEEAEAGPSPMHTVDEDGDQGMLDEVNPTAKSWYDTASNHPIASSHTIQHSQGVIDLMPLRAQALSRYDPNNQLCQYEVPGGGTCLDPTCGDCHIRDTLPTDEETAKYLTGVFPGLDVAQIRSHLLRARKTGSGQPQGFTAIVAETLRLLGLR